MSIIDLFDGILIDPNKPGNLIRNISWDSAFHLAARSTSHEVVEALLVKLNVEENGTRQRSLRLTNRDRKTALTIAVESLDNNIVKTLLGADPILADEESSLLHTLLRTISSDDLLSRDVAAERLQTSLAIIDLLVNASANSEVLLRTFPDGEGKSPYVSLKSQDLQRNNPQAFAALREHLKTHIFKSFYNRRDLMEKALYGGSSGKWPQTLEFSPCQS